MTRLELFFLFFVEFRRNYEDYSLKFRTLSLGLTFTVTQAWKSFPLTVEYLNY